MLTLETAMDQLNILGMKIAEAQRGTDPSLVCAVPIATMVLAAVEAWAARTAEAKKLKSVEALMILASLAEFLLLINAGPEYYGLAVLHAVTFFGVFAATNPNVGVRKN